MDRNLESDGGGSAAADAHEWRSAWTDRISGKGSSSRSGFLTTAHSQSHRAQRMSLKRRRGRLERRVLLPWLFFCQGYSASPIQDTYGIPTKLARQTGYLDTPAASTRWIGGGWERRGEENLKCSASARLINYLTNHAE